MRTSITIAVLLVSITFAFTPNATLTGLADNTAMDLGAYTCNQPVGDASYPCSNITDYSGLTYDTDNDRMLMFGGGHATTMTDALMAFSFTTLTWSALFTSTPCASMVPSNLDRTNGAWISGPSGPFPRPVSRHTYDELVAPAGRGEFLVMAECNGGQSICPQGFDWSTSDPFFMQARVAHYGFQSGTWSFSATAPGGELPAGGASYASMEFDPVSGKIIILGRFGISTYDPATKVKVRYVRGDWGELADSAGNKLADGALNGWCNLVYYPPTQRFYYMDRGYTPLKVWELQLNRADLTKSTVTNIVTTGTTPPSNEAGYDYDSKNQIIGGGVAGNTFYAFDPRTKVWTARTIQGGAPGTMSFHAMGYDPVNNVFIFITQAKHTWAYRYGNGTGIERCGLRSIQAPAFSVSPNPFSRGTTIQVAGQAAVIELFSVGGARLTRWEAKAGESIRWNAGTLPAGLYFVKAVSGNRETIKPVLLQK